MSVGTHRTTIESFAQLGAFITAVNLAVAGFAQPSTRAASSSGASKFVRFVPMGDGGQLRTSIVSYRNADGVTVDLIGAVHVADPEFFSGLNERFESYDSVLFEMVRPRGMAVPASRAIRERREEGGSGSRRGGGALRWVGPLQLFLRDQLELEFQLEGIDYDKPNFVHADLDAETFIEMQQERGESMARLMLQTMLSELGKGPQASLNGFALLGAMRAPDRARQLKLILGKQIARMEDTLASWDGPKGTVIVTERNKAALKVVRDRIADGDRKLAVFYGAAHLTGMDKILTEEMGFTQVGEPIWLTAWDMTQPATQPATAPALRP